MTSIDERATRIARHHEQALEVVREHGASREDVETLEELSTLASNAGGYSGYHLNLAHAVFIGELAGIVQEQAARIEELEKAAKPGA